MTARDRTLVGLGAALGILLAIAVGLWWTQGPSQGTVRRTVITTVQEESPASFLVTGTLDIRATVAVDSSQFMTSSWLTALVSSAQPGALSLLRGRARTEVRVPGRVSYGFDVQTLTPSMIRLSDGGVVGLELPALSVHSVEPALPKLEVRTSSEGWLRVYDPGVGENVRVQALKQIEPAFRRQAQRRIETATQPRVNTARALEAMLRPALQAAGVENPRFRIRVGERLVLQPEG